MLHRTSARVVVCLFVSCLFAGDAWAAARGFFTGKRAEVIAILAGATRPNLSREDALAIVARARTANEGVEDRYLEYFIGAALADIYRNLGDTDAASAQMAEAMEQFTDLIETDGPAQAFYTLYLIAYDLERPLASLLGSQDEFASLQQVEQQLAAALEEIEYDLEDPDLEPQQRAMLQRAYKSFKQLMTDLAEGLFQNDARKLKRARRELIRFIDTMQKQASENEITEDDKVFVAGFRGVMIGMIDLSIAGAERNRRAYEKAARLMGENLNKMMELGALNLELQ